MFWVYVAEQMHKVQTLPCAMRYIGMSGIKLITTGFCSTLQALYRVINYTSYMTLWLTNLSVAYFRNKVS